MTMLRSIFLLLLCSTSSCKEKDHSSKDSPVSEASAEGVTQCQGCDVSCYRKATNQAVEGQIECLGAIVDAIGPGWLKVVASAKDIVELVYAAKLTTIPEDEEETNVSQGEESGNGDAVASNADFGAEGVPPVEGEVPEGLALTQVAGLTIWDAVEKVIEYAGKANNPIKPRWLAHCATQAADMTANLFGMMESIERLNEHKSITATALRDLVLAVGHSVGTTAELAALIGICTKGNNARSILALKKFTEALDSRVRNLGLALGALNAIPKCGVNIVKGAVVFANNVACYMEDLGRLREQEVQLKKACANHDEWIQCNRACDARFAAQILNADLCLSGPSYANPPVADAVRNLADGMNKFCFEKYCREGSTRPATVDACRGGISYSLKKSHHDWLRECRTAVNVNPKGVGTGTAEVGTEAKGCRYSFDCSGSGVGRNCDNSTRFFNDRSPGAEESCKTPPTKEAMGRMLFICRLESNATCEPNVFHAAKSSY